MRFYYNTHDANGDFPLVYPELNKPTCVELPLLPASLGAADGKISPLISSEPVSKGEYKMKLKPSDEENTSNSAINGTKIYVILEISI